MMLPPHPPPCQHGLRISGTRRAGFPAAGSQLLCPAAALWLNWVRASVSVITTTLQLLLLFYLPGALLFRAPMGDRARRAALPAEERVFWGVLLSVAWTLAVALALASAERYRFGTLLAVNAAASTALLLAFRQRLRFAEPTGRPTAGALAPVALVALGLWMHPIASEYVMGGKDPGTYMNEGIQIAQRGGLVIHDPVVAAVPSATRDLFFPSHGSDAYYGVRFMGFFIRDPHAGTVVGQFPHVFPASIAIGYGLHGLTGARQAVTAWALLGVVAVYFLGARWLGRAPAAAAAAMLLLNVVHAWFARYPNAEVAMMTLAFAALLAFARARVDGDRFFAPVAAALLVLLLFVRIDAAMVWAAVGAAIVLGWLRRQPDGDHDAHHPLGWGFWAIAAAGAALAALYYARLMTGYLAVPAVFVRETVPVAGLGIGALVALAGFWAASRHEPTARRLRVALPWTLGIVLAGFAVYAFFFREAAGRTAVHDASAFRTFAWYVGPWWLALAVVGALALLPRVFWRDPAAALTGAGFSLFFFYKIRIVPEHFWMTRRFLPVILPMMALMVAGIIWALARRLQTAVAGAPAASGDARTGRPRRIAAAAAAGAVLVVACGALTHVWRKQIRPVLNHIEYAGLIPRLEALAGRFGDNDLVIVESRNASDLHVLALPLAYIYAKPVLVLNSPRPERAMMEAFIDDARRRYREVFFLGSGGTDLLTRRIGVEPVGSDRFQMPEYESPANAYPSGVRRKEFDFGIYRFVDVPALAREPVLVIGDRDDLQVVRFHAKEKDPQTGRTYRWTRDVSYVSLLNITPATRTITLWMADGRRPASLPRAEVEVSLGEQVLGRATVGADVTAYTFDVPAELAAAAAASEDPARLRLRTNTWRPRTAIGAPDDRDLGVMLSRVEVR